MDQHLATALFPPQQHQLHNQCAMSLAESSSSSSSSSNLILSVLASVHPASPGPLPSEGVMASLAMMASSSCSGGSSATSSSTPLPPPPRHGLSIKSFATREEYLQAMLEDISYWVSELVFLNNSDPATSHNDDAAVSPLCTADNFFSVIETGEVLCELANRICECIVHDSVSPPPSQFSSFQPLTYRRRVRPESFFARDNVSTFLNWVCSTWRIHECLMFETDDLVLRKSEKNVILCLLEVARKAYANGLKVAPMLVHMEAEIDKELLSSNYNAQQTNSAKLPSASSAGQPAVFQQISFNNLVNLDELVRTQLSRCSCPIQFPMIKVADGKYRIGNSNVLIFVRVLRSHVMVRVGGGWDTLEAYLNRHDPCRCQTGGHSAAGRLNSNAVMIVDPSNVAMMSTSVQQPPSLLLQSSAAGVDFMTTSLVEPSSLHVEQQQPQPSSFSSSNSNNAKSSTTSVMPPTPPLSFGDTTSSSCGESSPALAPSPTTNQRHRSTSRPRSSRRVETPPLHSDEPPLPSPAIQQQIEVMEAVVFEPKKPAISKRQKSSIAVPTSLAVPQENRRRKKNGPVVTHLSSGRVRSAPTARNNNGLGSSNSVIMIGRTSNGKHFIASNSVAATTSDVVPKRQSMSPIMKDDTRRSNRPRSSPVPRQPSPLSLLTTKSRLVARPRKDPLAGVTSAPSKIPLPVSSLLRNANIVVAQLSPSSSSSSSSLLSPAVNKTRYSFDDDQFQSVRATLVMTICEEEDEDGVLLSSLTSSCNSETSTGKTPDLLPTVVDAAIIKCREDRHQQQQHQKTVPTSSLLINTPPEHESKTNNRQSNVDDLLLNDFIAMEKLVENEMLLATGYVAAD